MAMLDVRLPPETYPSTHSTRGVEETIQSAAAECASIGDLECAMFLLAKLRGSGHRADLSCLDPFFLPPEKNPARRPTPETSRKPRWKTYQDKSRERHGLVLPLPTHIPPLCHPADDTCPKLTSASASSSSKSRRLDAQGEDDLSDTASSSSWPQLIGSFPEAGARGWESLPTEILQRIVEPLGPRDALRAGGVCSSWALSMHHSTQYLSLSWCTRDSVNLLLQSLMPKLKSVVAVNLRRCRGLADSGVAAVAAHSGPDLQSLLLCMCPLVTDRALLRLSASCSFLQVLDLSGCKAVTEAGVAALARGCLLLRELSLCGCPQAGTILALESLGQSCPGLEVLNLGWCDRVRDHGIMALVRGCPALRALDLCGCTAITDAAVVSLASHLSHLQSLNLHCCRLITDTSVHALTSRALSLGQPAVAAVRESSPLSQEALHRQRPLTRAIRAAVSLDHGAFSSSSSSSTYTSASSGGDGVSFGGSQPLPPRLTAARSWEPSLAASSKPPPPPPSRVWGSFDTVLHQDLPPVSSGLVHLNVSGCLNLRAHAVQALCLAAPNLHTCPKKRSLQTSGCMALVSVRCRCLLHPGAHVL